MFLVSCQSCKESPISLDCSPVLIHLRTYISSPHDVCHQATGGALCVHTHAIRTDWEINGSHLRKKWLQNMNTRYSYPSSLLYMFSFYE